MDKKEIWNIVFDVAKYIGYCLILLFFVGLIAIIYLAPETPSANSKDNRFLVSRYMVDGGKIKVITDTQTNCEYLFYNGEPLPLNLRSCK